MSKSQKRKRLLQDDGDSKPPAYKSIVDGCDSYSALLRHALLSLHGFSPELMCLQFLNSVPFNSLFVVLKSLLLHPFKVLAAEPKSIENAIKCGGLAPKKTVCIKNILSRLQNERGRLCLEYLHGLSVEEVKTELSHFKGIGPKTVFEISKALGWVPKTADRNKTYVHLNRRIPDELKFDLNCLLYTHTW